MFAGLYFNFTLQLLCSGISLKILVLIDQSKYGFTAFTKTTRSKQKHWLSNFKMAEFFYLSSSLFLFFLFICIYILYFLCNSLQFRSIFYQIDRPYGTYLMNTLYPSNTLQMFQRIIKPSLM